MSCLPCGECLPPIQLNLCNNINVRSECSNDNCCCFPFMRRRRREPPVVLEEINNIAIEVLEVKVVKK